MNIVITGAAGFLGTWLRHRLATSADPVIAVGRPAAQGLHRCDLADPSSLLPAHRAGEPFCLIHLAWVRDRPTRWADHAEHVRLLAGLLDYWAERGLRRLVAVGSAEGYGNREGRLREADGSTGALSPSVCG